MRAEAIVAHNVSLLFSAQSRRGVSGVSLTIRAGEVTCVLGPSGSGKSTLLRILAGLEKPDSGRVALQGRAGFPGEVVYVPQDYALWPHLTVLENLVLAPCAVRGISLVAAREEADVLLERFGLASYASARVNTLSGGQKQRVALLRALAMKPAVLLLDEVTSALDPELIKGVLDTIRALAVSGYAMVVVTHHVRLAMAIADRIIFLDEGEVVHNEHAASFFRGQADPRILSFIRDIAARENAIEIFEGAEQFQAYHMNMLKCLPDGSVIRVAGAAGDRWFELMGTLAGPYNALRAKKRIVWEMTAYELGRQDRLLLKEFPELNRFRMMPSGLKNPANYNVAGGITIIQIFGAAPAVLEIRDAAVAETYNGFFDTMWNASLPVG